MTSLLKNENLFVRIYHTTKAIWKTTGERTLKNTKMELSAGKGLTAMFWDNEG